MQSSKRGCHDGPDQHANKHAVWRQEYRQANRLGASAKRQKQSALIHAYATAALAQFSSEIGGQGWFNRFVDGLNRMLRPAFALGTIALFVSAIFEPQWFGELMQGLALVRARATLVAAWGDYKLLF